MIFDDEDDNSEDWNPDNWGDDDFKSEEREEKRYKAMPVFQKAEEIVDITRAIVDSIDEEKDVLLMREQMMVNAYTIPAKIAGAEAGDLYSIRMDNAVLIKLAARELQTQTSFCNSEELCDPKYLELLQNEIENFRKLFIEWIKSFDKSNDIDDEWNIRGLHE